MMKREYLKPYVEYVDMLTEAITDGPIDGEIGTSGDGDGWEE